MMAVAHLFFPSPLVGEGAEQPIGCETGEGSGALSLLRARPLTRLAFASLGDPPSPTRGEGKRASGTVDGLQ
jgi:hypothetical protein